jgi:hypothetical protein
MGQLSVSEKYAIGAAILLLLVALVNNAIMTLVISGVGLVVGLLVARTTSLQRAGLVAFVGFAVAAVLGVAMLLRR